MIVFTVAFALGLTACGKADVKPTAGENQHAAGQEAHTNHEEAGEHAAGREAEQQTAGKGHGDGHSGHEAGSSKAAASSLKASFTFPAGGAKANEPTELTIQITDKDGAPVNDYKVSHEKLLHLIIVNRDLSYFNHIHPNFKGDGKFTINTAFPAGGEYKVFADFVPNSGSATTLSDWVKVEGDAGERAAIAADSKLTKEIDGKEVELALSSLKAKEDVKLTFTIRDAKTKKGIDNLEPYLGAVGHVVILSADAGSYLHVHPLDEQATGPKAEFATAFPQSGVYKIWGQFQHNGKVITAPFAVEVK